ncbi:extracellular solute-binding protein [Microbacterium karelineae]|uniref:extracellular solute-binding protein n=1 Tax=Microbacterium karelineae TaxID=2654283 RepID=UPI0012EA4401|nr:extracellular solute-binding protein [Microbacterium karelineae]
MTSHSMRGGRRRALAAAAAAAAASVALSACGAGAGGVIEEGDGTLPNHVPLTYVEPDVPGAGGAPDGYTSLPDSFTTIFDEPPGSGGSYTAMTPLWGPVPDTDNAYFRAVNEAMGTDIEFQISDGVTYGDKLATVLADEKNLPDWVSIPTWNFPPRFGQAVGSLFEDLTPFLAGDSVEKYSNLANIPTDSWRSCSWNGKIYGIPFPSGAGQRNAAFYRADLIPDATMPTNADEMLDFVTENHRDGHWGTNDLWVFATQMFGVAPEWVVGDDGQLVHRVETPEYRAALEWMTELYASGAVHPDAVADNQAEGKQRFESGSVVITADGDGAWGEQVAKMATVDPDFEMAAIPVFAADGGDPVLYKSDAAAMCSYLKASDDAQIEELLAAADFLASPFGTSEYMLVNNGVEGVHYELDEDNAPTKTDAGQAEVQPSYLFLVAPPETIANPQFPDYVEARVEWKNETTEYEVEDPFYGIRVTEPNRFASLKLPFEDLEKDIARGRASLDDLDTAIETWRTSGGDELREIYQDILDSPSEDGGEEE